MAKAWTLLAPPALVADSCLIVMGSEGRGDQILRTDQDNGLILRDGIDPAGARRRLRGVQRGDDQLRLPALPGRRDGLQSGLDAARSPPSAPTSCAG